MKRVASGESVFHGRNNLFETLPVLPSLEILDISYNPELVHLPSFPNVVNIIAHDCPKLTSIDSCPLLQILDIGNTHISTLGNFPKLEQLIIFGTSLDEKTITTYKTQISIGAIVDAWKNARNENEVLDLSGLSLSFVPESLPKRIKILSLKNNNIRDISILETFPRIKKLNVSSNQIQTIPSIPTLIELVAKKNSITSISSFLPNLNILDVSKNMTLTEVPTLSELTDLNIKNTSVHSLPRDLDSLEYLVADSLNEETKQIYATQLGNDEEWEPSPDEEQTIESPMVCHCSEEKINCLPNIPKEESDFLRETCLNKEDIISKEDLDTSKGLTVILSEQNQKIFAYCYPYNQLLDIFQGKNQDYIWEEGKANKDFPVFLLPHTGVWIDIRARINLGIYNTLLLKEIGKKGIGSQYGSSSYENIERMIYTLVPVSFSIYSSHMKIEPQDWKRFQPKLRDFNPFVFSTNPSLIPLSETSYYVGETKDGKPNGFGVKVKENYRIEGIWNGEKDVRGDVIQFE